MAARELDILRSFPVALPHALVVVDSDSIVSWAAGDLQTTVGHEREEMIGRSVGSLLRRSPNRFPHPPEKIEGAFADPGERRTIQVASGVTDGSAPPFRVTLHPLPHQHRTACVVLPIWGERNAEPAGSRSLSDFLQFRAVPTLVFDDDLVVVDANDEACSLLAAGYSDVAGMPLRLFEGTDAAAALTEGAVRLKATLAVAGRISVPTPNGFDDVEYRLHGEVGPGLHVATLHPTSRQPTDIGRVADLSHFPMAIGDEYGHLTTTNPAWTRALCWSPTELRARPFLDLVHPDDRDAARAQAAGTKSPSRTVAFEARFSRKDGRFCVLQVHGVVQNDRWYWSADDVTEQRQYQQLIHTSEARFRQIIQQSPAAISIRDGDFRFQLVNRAFCELFRLPPPHELIGHVDSSVLPPHLISRGEDYRLLGGESLTQEETLELADGERTFLTVRFPLIGIGGPDAIVVMRNDITERRRREKAMEARQAWERQISRAIHDGRLATFAQPILDVVTGRVVGEELLVRMLRDGGTDDYVAPDDFLPQARLHGLMPTIDRFMIAEAVQLANAGRNVAVNVSGDTIVSEHATDQLIELIAEANEPSRISIELTESAALASMTAARHFTQRLRELGCGLALDDFGTGYGSFTELTKLHVSALKIDMSFVQRMRTSLEDERVVRLIAQIASEFGMRTVAEGVEDAETLALLAEIGVDEAQGYFIGPPSPAWVGPLPQQRAAADVSIATGTPS